MIKRVKYIVLLIPLIWGCRGTSNLTEDQYLYTGAKIEIITPVPVEDKGKLLTKMENHLKPEPNDAIFGIRPKLWFYNIYDTVKKDKGFKYWVKYKLGSPPVLLSDVDPERVASTLQLAFENNGFFNNTVDYKTESKKKTASIVYDVKVDEPYTFGEIHLPEDETALARALQTEFNNTNIQTGARFNLEDLQNERLRLETALQNKGFYYFNDTYLLYQIDTTIGKKQVEVFMTFKPETPYQAKRIQQINKVTINTDFNIMDSVVTGYDTLMVEGFTYVRQEPKFRPEIIASHVRLRENNLYTRNAEEVTISRLIDLGVFKYVNINFMDAGPGKLDAFIRLSPMKKKSLQLELRGITKSNSFVGPAFQSSFRNRNFLQGAELYQLTLSAGYEWQIGPGTAGQALNSYELGVQNSLSIPRFIAPFGINQISRRFVPQTNVELGFRFLKRINYFQLNSFDFGFGYTWREDATKAHKLFPVDVSYIRLANTSDIFDSLLNINPFLQRSYENQFILGANYGYTYNSQVDKTNLDNTHNFYFNGNIDISGNLMHLAQNSLRSEENTDENPYTIFGSAYSQFIRTDVDLRYYFRIDRKNMIASRLIIGFGKAFGNSQVLPYTKQFTIGGSSSIRAFRARSLGPGSFQADQSTIFFDQTADIKLETNLEYRFDLIGSFKGAVFLDAGNIWSLKEDNREGGKFKTDSFLSQIAVGTGVGVRLDIQFFVLRLDLATPVRIPSREPGNRWHVRLNEVNDQGEKVSNLVLNIAIGYPF